MLILVPHIGNGYHYCIIHPADTASFWHQGLGGDKAVALEVDPAWWETDEEWLVTYEQEWPSDATRICSRLGYEVSLVSGVPLIGRELLEPKEEYFWHNLTLGILPAQGHTGDLSEWSSLRERLLQNLLPNSWIAPQSCIAVLHLAEADYAVILTPSRELWENWVAGQVATHFHMGEQADGAEKTLLSITRWLLKEAADVGVRLSTLEMRRDKALPKVAAAGRWGRGKKTLVRAGKASGESFRQEWIGPVG